MTGRGSYEGSDGFNSNCAGSTDKSPMWQLTAKSLGSILMLETADTCTTDDFLDGTIEMPLLATGALTGIRCQAAATAMDPQELIRQ